MAAPQRMSQGTQKITSWNPFDKAASTTGPTSAQGQGGSKAPDNPYYVSKAPSINAPVGGGALRCIEDKFQVNAATGTSSLSVPFAVPPGRGGFGPSVSLSYDSGSGSGPFGLGWSLSLPSISRKTSRGIPRYSDKEESDVFLFTGVEDLVPKVSETTKLGQGKAPAWLERTDGDYTVREYWPRSEGVFNRIERWFKAGNPAESFWRTISGDNVVSFYGRDENSRIVDRPTGRVFTWLLCATYDATGNSVEYQYKAEDSAGVRLSQAHEARRTDAARATNRYIKSVRYGNTKPVSTSARHGPVKLASGDVKPEYMFEIVFDYGDHRTESPSAAPDQPWLVRKDPFSTYTSGFEIRSYRLCRRFLLFHHMKEQLGVQDYLVQSMELSYKESGAVSVLTSLTQAGHALDTTSDKTKAISRSLPPIEFEYSTVHLSSADIRSAPASALQNLPAGLAPPVQWVDLEGNGKASPLLVDQAGWVQLKNLSSYTADYHDASAATGQVLFGTAEAVLAVPSTADAGSASLLDLGGNGRLDVVRAELGQQGFYERTDEGGWTEFTRFAQWPTIDMANPNLRYLDLTGNGLADIIIAEADNFVWYPALGTDGYGEAVRAVTAASEEDGPRVLFSDGLESVYLADFSGDGLADLVRIRNGDVCYWPNLGYGRFGAKVAMDNAPWMAPQDMFSQGRVQLADIDGSGIPDILYFPSQGGLRVYMNQCGNSWSAPVDLYFPLLDSTSQVTVVDLFGLGLSTVVWSTTLPSFQGSSLQYLDFTRGRKPYLLTASTNGPVATRLQYTSSVTLREADERKGRPWATRLAFPVQCLTQATTYDQLGMTYTESSYSYRDGYFDGVEREFHGFGMVEIVNKQHALLSRPSSSFPSPAEMEAFANKLSSPITRTVSWYHLGGWEAAEAARKLQRKEYYQAPGTVGLDLAVSLRKPALPRGMTPAETQQAYRALRGSSLRTETYQVDGTSKQHIPISISEGTACVRMLQGAMGEDRPGVFLVTPGESVSIQLERDEKDPRISHSLPLEVDDWGNVTKAAAVAYGRRSSQRTPLHTDEDWKAQSTALVTYNEQAFTNSVSDKTNEYRVPVGYESRVYEVKGINIPSDSGLVTEARLSLATIHALGKKSYTDLSETPGLRLMSRTQTRFRSNDLSRMLGPSVLESMAIPGESYTLAMTPDLVKLAFHDPDMPTWLNNPAILGGKGESDGGYVDLESDGSWWIPSGQVRFADAGATSTQELEAARASFFQPVRFVDPFGKATTVAYDSYQCFPVSTTDAAGNTSTALLDYRTLQPRCVTDQNGNQVFAAFDVLGQCVGVAVAGKPDSGLGTGDTIGGFHPNTDPNHVLSLLSSDPTALVVSVLAKCTSVSFSWPPSRASGKGSQGEWLPGFSISLSRDTHVSQLPDGALPQIQASVSYSDGRGLLLQTRTLASPTPGPNQWVISGVTLTTASGAVLREFDSAFSSSPEYGPLPADTAFSSGYYDASGRCVALVLPNRSWTKTVYGAWTTLEYDPGDTLLIASPTTDADVGVYLSSASPDPNLTSVSPTWYQSMTAPSASPLDKQIAQTSAAVYANRPTQTWLDVMGKTMLAVVDAGGTEGTHISRCYTDRQGRARKVIDAEGRMVGVADFDMVGHVVRSVGMDTGESWVVKDVLGEVIRTCNSRGVQSRMCYDALRRPVRVLMREGWDAAAREFTARVLVYGDGDGNGDERNLRGKLCESRDQGVVVKNLRFDHLGNAVEASQQMVREYKDVVDWSKEVPLEEAVFTWSERFDALGRSVSKTRSDGSVVTNTWDPCGRVSGLRIAPKGQQPGPSGNVIKEVKYNQRGQRLRVVFGNGAECRYAYHATSFWMTSKTVTATDKKNPRPVLDLRYSYDCMGRAVRIEDLAQQDIFFRGQVVKPVQEFAYDAIGRLSKVSGREHVGQAHKNWQSVPAAISAAARESSPSDGKTMANYTETYRYSPEGNMLSITHVTSDPTVPGWTRTFDYSEPSLVEPDKHNNRLSSTTIGGEVSTYKYEGLAGSMGLITSMSGFPVLKYDFCNRLCASSTQQQSAAARANGDTPEMTWYRYDADNKRIRKVSEGASSAGKQPFRTKDHIYPRDGIEIFRKFTGAADSRVVASERWTWNTLDDEGRLLSVEAEIVLDVVDEESVEAWDAVVSMWAMADHTSSVTLELDDSGGVVSREEFSPYGSTTYDASANLKADKRYRYAGKERDSETGLYYFENRYLMPWLGRWLSPDPAGAVDGPNVYCYVGCDPVNHTDPSGLMMRSTINKFLSKPLLQSSRRTSLIHLPRRHHHINEMRQSFSVGEVPPQSFVSLIPSLRKAEIFTKLEGGPLSEGKPHSINWQQVGLVASIFNLLTHDKSDVFRTQDKTHKGQNHGIMMLRNMDKNGEAFVLGAHSVKGGDHTEDVIAKDTGKMGIVNAAMSLFLSSNPSCIREDYRNAQSSCCSEELINRYGPNQGGETPVVIAQQDRISIRKGINKELIRRGSDPIPSISVKAFVEKWDAARVATEMLSTLDDDAVKQFSRLAGYDDLIPVAIKHHRNAIAAAAAGNKEKADAEGEIRTQIWGMIKAQQDTMIAAGKGLRF